jgi:glycosyltransferase involved in cell wall biosynthesis
VIERTPELSVVVPVYRNRQSLAELAARVRVALADVCSFELVLVDDACPDGSGELIDELAEADDAIVPVHLPANGGQHRAVLAGLAVATGSWCAIMDADLQDPPEALPVLLRRAAAGDVDAVFAGRSGNYESRWRLITGRTYRRLLAALLQLPPDGGIFVLLSRDAVERVLALSGPAPSIVAMVGCAGVRAASVPVVRAPSTASPSAYTEVMRLAAAARALGWALRHRRRARRARADHNSAQRAYFEERPKPRMLPADTPYIRRQLGELIACAGLEPGARVLDVGCGMGRYTIPLADRGFVVEGLDLSPVLLDALRAYDGGRERVAVHAADVADPPEELKGRFDAVVGFFALHHVHDLEACFRGMRELVTPGGRIAFLEPNPLNPLYYLQIAFTPGMSWQGDGGIVRMRPRRVFAAMDAAGLTPEGVSRFGFLPPFAANTRTGAAAERVLERVRLWRAALPFQVFVARAPDGR